MLVFALTTKKDHFMYVTYCYQAGSSTTNVIADLVKLLTGETNKANLSANCVQANTSIISTVAAGWTVYDASAAADTQVLRSINQDATTYKYAKITVAAGLLTCLTCESWNAGTHAPTNATTAVTSVMSTSSGGYFYIYATSKNLFVVPWLTVGFSYPVGVAEFSRDTGPASYPAAACVGNSAMLQVSSSTAGCYVPRMKNQNAPGDLSNVSCGFTAVMGTNNQNGGLYGVSMAYRDEAENTYLAVFRINASTMTTSCAPLGLFYDLLATGYGAGAYLDQITYGGTVYVIWRMSQAVLLVPMA